MNPPNNNAAEGRRSPSLGTPASNSDEDDYDLNAMSIADGFRPISTSASTTASHLQNSSPPRSDSIRRPSPTTSATDPSTITLPDRSTSITKPSRAHDALALRHDGSRGSFSDVRFSQSSSSSADARNLRSESPYQGPSDPSHPYQMYPQRALSVATSATAPMSERSYTGPQRPTHPYDLYTQATTLVEVTTASTIPVGFPGRPDDYQRRIGPDGEEAADMIGPLGHTEELPPYTRYPDVAYVRKPTSGGAQDSVESENQNGVESIPGAGGIGLATRNPEFESRDDLGTPQSRLSTRSITSDAMSQHEINTAAGAYNEKNQDPRWQKRAKKRMWGVIPYWAVCLVALALLVMGIILGAVIGTLFTKQETKKGEKPDEDAIAITYTTATLDTLPLPTKPADLPPLDIGTFSLPHFFSSQAPTTCFNDTAQAQAWTCDIPFHVYSMSVSKIPNGSPISDYTLQLVLSNSSSTSGLYTWGSQPPTIDDPIRMRLVNDTDEPDKGPAWFGQIAYNKTVIIAEERFPNVGFASKKDKRRRSTWGPDGLRRNGVMGAQVGDRPWICTWPGTLLEVFIYPSHNNTFGTNADSSSRTPTPTISLSSASDITPGPKALSVVSTASAAPSSSSTRPARLAAPPYPKVIKIEESRVSDDESRAAICQQMEICEDGMSSVPVFDDDGDPVEVSIVENHRSEAFRFVETKRSLSDNTRILFRRKDEPYTQLSECGCLWWFK